MSLFRGGTLLQQLCSQFPSPAHSRLFQPLLELQDPPGMRMERSRTKHAPISLFPCSNSPKQAPLGRGNEENLKIETVSAWNRSPFVLQEQHLFFFGFLLFSRHILVLFKDSAKQDSIHVERREKKEWALLALWKLLGVSSTTVWEGLLLQNLPPHHPKCN